MAAPMANPGERWTIMQDWRSLAAQTPYAPIYVYKEAQNVNTTTNNTANNVSVIDNLPYYRDNTTRNKLTDSNPNDFVIVNFPNTIRALPVGSLHTIINFIDPDVVDYRFSDIKIKQEPVFVETQLVERENAAVAEPTPDLPPTQITERNVDENLVAILGDNPMNISFGDAVNYVGQEWTNFRNRLIQIVNTVEIQDQDQNTLPEINHIVTLIAENRFINSRLVDEVLQGTNTNMNKFTALIGLSSSLLSELASNELRVIITDTHIDDLSRIIAASLER